MSSCGNTIQCQRDADLQVYFVPQGLFSFAETIPTLRIWNASTSALSPLLSIETTQTPNGSVWSRENGSGLVVLMRKEDLQALPQGDLFFDITLMDFNGLVNPFMGGAFILYADGMEASSCCQFGPTQTIYTSLSGDTHTVVIEGSGLARVMDTSLQDAQEAAAAAQNAAVLAQAAAAQSGSGSADDAAASAAAALASQIAAALSASEAGASAVQSQDSADNAAASESASITASGSAAISAGSAALQANNAYTYAGQAQMASLAAGFYPGAQANIPRGLTAATIATPGSGYTDGIYDITTTGGSMSVQGIVRVTVAGGVITSAVVTDRGLYIGGSPSAPTVPLGALGGGTGGSVTVTLGYIIQNGQTYWSDHASDSTLGQLYLNNGTATPAAQAGETFIKTLIAGMVPCSFGGSANAPALTPLLPVSGGGMNQRFWAFCGGANNGAMTCSVAGVFGGAQTTVLMPDGTATPPNATKTLYPMQVVPVVISGNNRFILVEPVFQQQQSVIACTILSDTTGAIVAKITNPQIKTAADLSGTRLQMKMVNNKAFASPTLELRAYDGTTVLITATPIRDKDDQATLQAANLWLANDTIEVERILPSGRWNLVETTDSITAPLAEAQLSVRLKTPKPLRPVSSIQTGENLCEIGVRMNLDNYADDTLANQSDHLKIAYMNVAPFMGLTTTAPDGFMALNSMWMHGKNIDIEVGNFVYTALDSGTTVETGLVWSAFENVLIAGDMANAGNPSQYGVNFQLTGRAHGHVSDVVRTRLGYRKDSSVGLPIAATKGAALTVTVNTASAVQVGQRVRFSGVVGMTELNSLGLITVTARTPSGNNTILTFGGVNSTGFGTFTSATEFAEQEVDITDRVINAEWDGIRIIENASYWMRTPSNQKWAYATDSTIFESEDDHHIEFRWQADFTHPDIVIDPGTRTGSYACMNPMTGMNRARGFVNGVPGSILIIDKRDGSQADYGYAEMIKHWNADEPQIKWKVENVAGPGYTHFEDSGSGPVPVPYAANVFGANNDYGTKDYWPIYPVNTPISLAGLILSGGARYTMIREPAEV